MAVLLHLHTLVEMYFFKGGIIIETVKAPSNKTEVITMADEEKKNIETAKEETPAWATKLQETLDDLPSRLREAMTPQESDPSPQPQQEEVTEIPLPEIPQPEQPPQENPEALPLTEPQEEKPKKKRNWMDFFL